jgi:transposase
LVPTKYSSGSTRAQGGVTKTGNGHARRLLIEAAVEMLKDTMSMLELYRLLPIVVPTDRDCSSAGQVRS